MNEQYLEAARQRLTQALKASTPRRALIEQALQYVTHAIVDLKEQELVSLREELGMKLTKTGRPRKGRSDAGKQRGKYKSRSKNG